MEVKVGDIVQLRKKHPCGTNKWEVTWAGANISIKCQKCQRHLSLERGIFERRVRSLLTHECDCGD